MDSQKPQSVWVERQERTIGQTKVVIAGFVLAFCCALAGLSWVGFSLATSTWILVAVAAVPFVLSFVMLLSGYRRSCRILTVVPGFDGLVCPKCVRPLEEESCRCPRCKRKYVGVEVVRYWSEFAASKKTVMVRWMEMSKSSPLLRHRAGDWLLKMVMKDWFMPSIYVFFIVVPLMVVNKVWLGGSLVSSAMPFLPWVFALVGMSLITVSWKRRDGEELHCSRCDYVKEPEAGDFCPECGNNWSEFGGAVKGQVVSSESRSTRHTLSTIGGVAMLVLGILLFTGRLNMNGPSVYRVVPTSSLIADVASRLGASRSEQWAELNQRQLSDVEKEVLARELLDCRMDNGLLSRNGESWLAKEIMSGTLSVEVRERYYREMFVGLRLECPEKAQKGDEVVVRVCGKSCDGVTGAVAWGDEMYVYVGGFFIDDESEPRGRRDHVINLGLFDTDSGYSGGHEYKSRLTIVPDECGPLKVRFVCWLVAEPSKRYEVVWHEDGTPEIGPGARWQKRLEVERVIDVVE